jgi:hypothetical protein
MDDAAKRIAEWEQRAEALLREVAELRATVAQRDERIDELERELARRDQWKRANQKPKRKKKRDLRASAHRRHPGVFRAPPNVDENSVLQHDVRQEICPHCGGQHLSDTGYPDDHLQVDIPEPKVEVHRFRHHEQVCADCGRVSQGRGDLELPGAHLGPRVRLFNAFARTHLGLSLEKANDLLYQLFGLTLSRAGSLGHIRWAGNVLDPIVRELFAILRESAVVHADETGWRINGIRFWAWGFSNSRLALFLIEKKRSAKVIRKALGESLVGVLVTDFYAAYHRIHAHKQKCLAHLLRDLHELRQKLPAASVRRYVQPLITLFQDAIRLAGDRDDLTPQDYQRQVDDINGRLDTLIFSGPTNPDCDRINRRLVKHRFELLTFLTHRDVPADNNTAERDIRSMAAIRGDAGVHRPTWSAQAFATIKSVVRTCTRNGMRFIDYGLSALRAQAAHQTLPPPLQADTG